MWLYINYACGITDMRTHTPNLPSSITELAIEEMQRDVIKEELKIENVHSLEGVPPETGQRSDLGLLDRTTMTFLASEPSILH